MAETLNNDQSLTEQYAVELDYLAHAEWQKAPKLPPLDDPLRAVNLTLEEIAQKLDDEEVLDRVFKLRAKMALDGLGPDDILVRQEIASIVEHHRSTLQQLEYWQAEAAKLTGTYRESKPVRE